MAEIYLAVERPQRAASPRLAAVKRMRPELATDPHHLYMFELEAALARRLRHRNHVQLYDDALDAPEPWMLFEYVDGVTLRELMTAAAAQQRRVPVAVALHVLLEACAGLHAAHELADDEGSLLGLVHRDLTPHNLMVTDLGDVRVLDFGIATTGGQVAHDEGLLKGKTRYLAPEQIRQEPLDRRTDIYTLGVVAFELLSGRRPFDRSDDQATLQAILAGRPTDLARLRLGLHRDLVATIGRALAPGRHDRFPTAEALADALRGAAASSGVVPDPKKTGAFVKEVLGATLAAHRLVVRKALEGSLPPLGDFAAFRDPDTEAELLDVDPTDSEVRELNAVLEPTLDRLRERLVPFALGAGIGALTSVLITGAFALERSEASAPLVVQAADSTAYRSVLEHLEASLDRRVVSTDAADVEAVVTGRVAVAALPVEAARAAAAASTDVVVLAIEERGGSRDTEAVLLGGQSQLAGAVLCTPGPHTDIHGLLREALDERGLDPDLDVRYRTVEPSGAARAVASGSCTFAALPRTPLDRLDAPFVAPLGSTPNAVWVAGPGLPTSLRSGLTRALYSWRGKGDGPADLTRLLQP